MPLKVEKKRYEKQNKKAKHLNNIHIITQIPLKTLLGGNPIFNVIIRAQKGLRIEMRFICPL